MNFYLKGEGHLSTQLCARLLEDLEAPGIIKKQQLSEIQVQLFKRGPLLASLMALLIQMVNKADLEGSLGLMNVRVTSGLSIVDWEPIRGLNFWECGIY